MEVTPYSNQNLPNMGNLGPAGNMGNVGNMGNISNSAAAPKPDFKPDFKPNFKPGFKPVGKGKGKGAYPMAGAKAGAAPGKTIENTLNCPPTSGGTVYDPMTVNVQHIFKPVIVRHIHRLHTVRKTHYVFEHQHFYPHTMSETCDEKHYNVQCGKPCFPAPHC
ncbi:hypothetical protein NBRC111894_2863 [Sporolactobacillus inulinus]|uniref:Inner spore coat protein D n=2 Tax=Sporolactobacillus inulinus TaxID=2078 RepID=A0A4Y1ZE81_9BACL|nr:spore coat protein [Sporolactobacillus inulinus]GAY77309.1 hypothetical protein NBRC111894_2863 [Sporolactobacillus inulinus]